jgi:8-oxo-dGTP diphosphatase
MCKAESDSRSTDARLDTRTPLKPANAAAAIITVSGRYLLQYRDNHLGIFFPAQWCCFGGGIEEEETPERALVRELREELALDLECRPFRYFTRFDYDLGFANLGHRWRYYFEVEIAPDQASGLRLGEGAAMRLFTSAEILTANVQITPYDGFALWFHINRTRLHPIGSNVGG